MEEPEELTYQLLREITAGFSEERKVGQGGFGTVYRGVTKCGEDVAVKILRDGIHDLDFRHFQNEFYNLMKVKHNNIVQVLGYCYEIEPIRTEYYGRIVFAEKIHKALCFEYLHNGSLRNHLSDESCGLDWHTRYKIIKGTCEGLRYIHEGLEESLLHLDLKPENILLDKNMMPKIADFGLSRIFGDKLTRTTQSPLGSLGYQPPEYIERGEISEKFDIYSLGVVIIRIVSGQNGYFKHQDMTSDEFIDHVQRNWRKRLQATCTSGLVLEACRQVETCAKIALNCLENDSDKRPHIVKIIDMLNEEETDNNEPSQEGDKPACVRTMHNAMKEHKLCEKYIVQLLGLAFLQHSMSPTTYGTCGEYCTVFTMHDLVHDLAISVLGDKILDQSKQGNIGGTRCCYALLTDCSKPLESCTASPARLSALRFLDCRVVNKLCGAAFEHAESLQVLDLSGCSIHKLPDSIGGLKHLRYLNAPRIQDRMVPECITKLSNLRYLSLRGSCTILTLPESIGEMEALVHLDLSGCLGIEKLPRSFDNLKSLEHVDFTNCRKISGISQCLARLTKLRYLNLSNCKNIGYLPKPLSRLRELHYLNLSNSSYLSGNKYLNQSSSSQLHTIRLHEALGSLTELKYLNLSHQLTEGKLQASFSNNLCNLVHLDLSWCSFLQDVAAVLNGLTRLQYLDLYACSSLNAIEGLQEAFGNLSELRHLNLGSCIVHIARSHRAQINGLLERICTLTKLEYLNLCRNDNIYSIPETLANLRMLHTLDISWCSSLQRLPASISEIERLKLLYTMGCWKLDRSTLPQYTTSIKSSPYFVVHTDDGESSSNSFQFKYETYNRLKISRLENVKSAKEARSIKLVEKTDITGLALEWTRDVKRFVDDAEVLRELEPPYNVSKFHLQGYSSFSFPSWMMHLGACLPDLTRIEMSDLPGCKSLPPLGQLPNLKLLDIRKMHSIKKIDADLYGGPRAFPQLKNFRIDSMKCLEEWNTAYSSDEDRLYEPVFPVLKYVSIEHCPRLRFEPRPPRSINELRLESGDEVMLSSRGYKGHFDCGVMPLHCWNSSSGTSQYFRISGLEKVKSVKEAQTIKFVNKVNVDVLILEWTRDAKRSEDDAEVLRELEPLCSIRHFVLRGYNSIRFPAWVMHIDTYLPHLTSITMQDLPSCNNLLPLGQLPNLHNLCIGGMDSIKEMGTDLYGGPRAFPRLERFYISGMKWLEEWNTTNSSDEYGFHEPAFPCLSSVSISDCPRLRFKPRPPRSEHDEFELSIEHSDDVLLSPRGNIGNVAASTVKKLEVKSCLLPLHRWSLLGHLPCLRDLKIIGCSDLTCSSLDFFQGLTSLTELEIDGSESRSFISLPEGLGGLPSLTVLKIIDCESIESLPESMQQLTCLKTLIVKDCKSMVSLPEGLGSIASLTVLEIRSCESIKTLPDSIQQLTCLHTLTVQGCKSIVALPERLGDLTSLTKLEITGCEGIKTLPDTIQQLPRLREIVISRCPELAQWCISEIKIKLSHSINMSANGILINAYPKET